ncbi:SDR family oxidoreductase [Geodermatophilus sabuli]|uniref:SDR family oxidoreductase n=1 Tax=Geodermatophilus sabuli TaxID=1564158 RepID=A0A7K3W604_9ACTN|nr:SDR family oxidoreductase [Geodermatophilus sabuli]NEK59267.1 SDR family oxidoreductase [Geodermatophilus sabuli]
MRIVVTGASGQLGRLVVEELLARGVPADQLLAAGRTEAKLADLAARGVPTAVVDYDSPATLDAAFTAGDTVLLISGNAVGQRIRQHTAVVDAAVRAGAERLVYTSVLSADRQWLMTPEHLGTEQAVKDSGLPATLLRHGWYSENYASVLAKARTTGEVVDSAGEGRVASASRADFAAGIAAVLSTAGHDGAVYEFSGDTAWTFEELAATCAEILGRDVVHRSVSSEEHAARLSAAGLDEGTVGFLVGMDAAIRDGVLGLQTGDLSRLSGRPTTPLADTLRAAG